MATNESPTRPEHIFLTPTCSKVRRQTAIRRPIRARQKPNSAPHKLKQNLNQIQTWGSTESPCFGLYLILEQQKTLRNIRTKMRAK